MSLVVVASYRFAVYKLPVILPMIYRMTPVRTTLAL